MSEGLLVSWLKDTAVVRRALLPATLALGLVAAASAFGGGAAAEGPRIATTPLRPDLVPLPTSQIQIRYVQGHKRLYLSFQSENAGAGPLEMRPVRDDCDGDGDTADDRTALQKIYGDTDGSGEYTEGSDTVLRTVVAGCFTFHAAHGHWHFQNYARYTLLSLDGDRLRTQSKVGFCMLDTDDVDPSLPGHPSFPMYRRCGDLDVQGISVGWSDTYSIYTAGQFIGVNGLPNGTYCLLARADPADRILESDETDNQVRTRIRFGDHRSTIRSHSC